MLSTDDAAVLQSIGHDIVHAFVAVTVETFGIAIYTVLVIKTSQMLRKKGTNARLYTWMAIIAMYILALSLWLIDVRNIIAEINLTLLSTSSGSLDDTYSVAVSDVLRLASYETFLYAYLTNIGDAVIVWRVYAFWSSPKERLVLVVPCLFLLGSISTSITINYCSARLGSGIELGTYQHPAVCHDIQLASYCTTLATTAVATALISYKAWEHRQIHLAAFGKSTRTRVQKIMAMLIESGIIYMLFFVVQVLMSQDSINASIEKSARLTIAFTIYEYTQSLVVAIYPTVIVILIHSKYSALDASLGSSTAGGLSVSLLSSRQRDLTNPSTLRTATSETKIIQPETEVNVNLYEMVRIASSRGSNGQKDDV